MDNMYRCQIGTCVHNCFTLRELILHMRLKHIHEKECALTCSIDGCVEIFQTVETFRKHVTVRHKDRWLEVNLRRPTVEIPVNSAHFQDVLSGDSSVFDGSGSFLEDDLMAHDEITVLDNIAMESYKKMIYWLSKEFVHLKLKLENTCNLPACHVKTVMSDITLLLTTFKQELCGSLIQQLDFIGVKDEVLNEILEDDISVGSALTLTPSAETKVLEDLGFVKPVKYLIEDDMGVERPIHYVPILQTLKEYLQHEDVFNNVMREARKEYQVSENEICDKKLINYTSGINMLNHDLFSVDPTALRITLYSDEFEPANPIGSHKVKHKVCGFYFSLNNIEAKYASSLQSIHLALLVKEAYVKKLGYHKVLEPLIADLKTLETVGVQVQVGDIQHNFRGAVCAFVGDNLSTHAIAGFRTCFSSGRICRFCMATYDNISVISHEGKCILRSKQGHDYHVASVIEERKKWQVNNPGKKYQPDASSLQSVYGVTDSSSLASLNYFHPVSSCPPDVFHDVLEGLIPMCLVVVLRGLIKSKIFKSVEEVNQLFSKFSYGKNDSKNKYPGFPVDLTSLKKKSIPGTGAEKWNLMRLFSLILGPHVPIGNDYWQLYLLSNKICDIVLAPVIPSRWLGPLTLLIVEHHDLWVKLTDYFPPKLHYLKHFPRMIQLFGPLRHFWVMRFEAFHLFFKKVAKLANNFINVTHTLSNRFQKKRCLEFAGCTALPQSFKTTGQRCVSLSDLEREVQVKVSTYIGKSETNLARVSSVYIEGLTIKVGDFVIIDILEIDEVPVFLHIKDILVHGGVWIVYGKLTFPQLWNEHLLAYEIQELREADDNVCVAPHQILLYQTLDCCKINGKTFIKLQTRAAFPV